jgi:hypothetical protein
VQIGSGVDIIAGGRDIWEKNDEGHFASVEHMGDFELTCRLESLTSADRYTKAGIMAREDAGANSRFVFFQVFPNNAARNKNNGGYEFQYRDVTGTDCHAVYPPDAPGEEAKFPVAFPDVWLRLAREGNAFTASASSDGVNWKEYTRYSLVLASSLQVGFAVTSHNEDATVTARFRDVALK